MRRLERMRNREKNEKERRQEDRKGELLEGYRQREEDETTTTEGVRNCDGTRARGCKKETGRRVGGRARKVFVIVVFYFFLES